MYFEDILRVASHYWQEPIDVNTSGDYYMHNIDDAWKYEDEKYKYWVEILNWSIGVVFGIVSDNLKHQGIKSISLQDLLVVDVEHRFREIDLKEESWVEERNLYKGFRVQPSSEQKITKEYLGNL